MHHKQTNQPTTEETKKTTKEQKTTDGYFILGLSLMFS
jgi:hypothetical protein